MNKIKLEEENSKIIKIDNKEELEKLSKILINLTKECEPNNSNNWKPILQNGESFWLVKYDDKIVGYLKSSDLEPYKNNDNFELLGGIKNKKGLQISGACNGIPKKYSNLATLLLNKIEKYAKENKYDYILLHAGTDRDYLISNNPERPGLYIKNNYKKIRILKAGEGGYGDIDLWIMRKEIIQNGGKKEKIKIKNITKNNFFEITQLNSGEDGKYVAPNYYTIIEALFDKKIEFVKAIYLENKPIGLIWFDPIGKDKMYIHRFMIDKNYQGKGYGKIAFNLSLKYFIKKYKPNKLKISSKNKLALELYKKFGFIDTKKKEYGESVLEVLTKNLIFL
jgi:diamine N-acetyltransferase